MYNFINSLTAENLILLANRYCNINFTKEEIDPLLPYLKSIYQDYYNNPCSRQYYQEQLKEKTNDNTYNKLMFLLEKFKLK